MATPSCTLLRSRLSMAGAALLALSACGGGGGGGGSGGGGLPWLGGTPVPAPAPAPPPPSPVDIAGKVMVLGAIGNATVCVDRNLNNACDADEPTSGKTGPDGAYSFSYTPADATVAAELAAAPLVAQIAAGAVADGASYEAAAPTLPLATRAYSLSAPASQRAQVNPLTTLVQVGIASGLSPAVSTAAVTLQLGVAADLIADYQSVPLDAVGFTDNARTLAGITNLALNAGSVLRVVDPASVTSPVPSDQLAALNFVSTSDYYVRTFPTDGVVDVATDTLRLVDQREGKTAGVPTAHDVLYPQVRLTSTGWLRCNATTPFTTTLGNPSRSSFCGDSGRSVGFTLLQDVAGRAMADVIGEMQATTDGSNTVTGFVPAAALADPAAVFPPGSVLRVRSNLDLDQPWFINNSNTDGAGFATLEALVAGRPASAVNLAAGTGTSGLGLYDLNHLLRVAFLPAAGAVQYYRCESTPPLYPVVGACTALTTGGYTISMVHGARLMQFSDVPVGDMFSTVRGFAEHNAWVYGVRKARPDLLYNFGTTRRLNGPALQALKSQLGLGAGL